MKMLKQLNKVTLMTLYKGPWGLSSLSKQGPQAPASDWLWRRLKTLQLITGPLEQLKQMFRRKALVSEIQS